MGHRQHGGRQRIGDLLLDHGRRLTCKGRADDDLDVGQVRNRIHRRCPRGHDTGDDHKGRGQQHQWTIGQRPPDQRSNHGSGSMAVTR